MCKITGGFHDRPRSPHPARLVRATASKNDVGFCLLLFRYTTLTDGEGHGDFGQAVSMSAIYFAQQ
jgi:hypothetical protein